MSLIADYGYVLLLLACLFGFFMAWGVGANDVANAMGTSVGSKALTIKQAIGIAMVFEFAGAYLAGGEVTETIHVYRASNLRQAYKYPYGPSAGALPQPPAGVAE